MSCHLTQTLIFCFTVCTEHSCPPPVLPEPTVGTFSFSDLTLSYKSQARLLCNDGYKHSTSVLTSQCLGNGTWSQPLPNCKGKVIHWIDIRMNVCNLLTTSSPEKSRIRIRSLTCFVFADRFLIALFLTYSCMALYLCKSIVNHTELDNVYPR